jgi:CheY-like chemotaxis protein
MAGRWWWLVPEPVSESDAPTVLVVDDSRLGLKVAETLLAQLGYRSELVRSGEEALAACARTRFAAVLMDCQLPGMDGLQTTARIRVLERGRRRTPVIAITASEREGDRERCLAAGMDAYLVKPMTPGGLEEVLGRLSGGGAAPRVAPATPEPVDVEAALDSEVLGRLQSYGDARLLGELIDLFLRSAPERISRLRAASSAGDLAQVQRLAHSLKGNCGNIGALRMARLCSRFETACQEPDQPALATLLHELTAEHDRVVAALNGVRPNGVRSNGGTSNGGTSNGGTSNGGTSANM